MSILFKLVEKLFCLMVCLPPLYMAYRFVRWYLRQNQETEGA